MDSHASAGLVAWRHETSHIHFLTGSRYRRRRVYARARSTISGLTMGTRYVVQLAVPIDDSRCETSLSALIDALNLANDHSSDVHL